MHLSISHKVGLDCFRTYDLEQYAITIEHKWAPSKHNLIKPQKKFIFKKDVQFFSHNKKNYDYKVPKITLTHVKLTIHMYEHVVTHENNL